MRRLQSYLVSFFPCVLTHEVFHDIHDQMNCIPFTVLCNFSDPETELPMVEEYPEERADISRRGSNRVNSGAGSASAGSQPRIHYTPAISLHTAQ